MSHTDRNEVPKPHHGQDRWLWPRRFRFLEIQLQDSHESGVLFLTHTLYENLSMTQPIRDVQSTGKRSRTCQGHSHTTLPWVLNAGASEGLLACSACCVKEVISDMPCYRRSAAPLHLPTEPKGGTDRNGSKRVFVCVCFFASKCFSHSFAY